MSNNGCYPDFFVVGAQKCGTTLLYGLLKKHPEIFLPDQKETHYFITRGGPLSYADSASTRLNETSIFKESKYLQLYENAASKIKGEVCPTYLYDANSAERIFSSNPNAKIIIVLRDPIQRAFSAYKHMKARGAELSRSFASALKNEEKYIDENWQTMSHYVKGSMYYEQVKRYFDVFPKENITVLCFEEMKANPIECANNILSLFSLSSLDSNIRLPQKNKTFILKNRFMSHVFINQPKFVRIIKNIVPNKNRGLIKESVLGLFSASEEFLSPHDVAYLKEFFSDDVEKLRNLVDGEFSGWCI